MKEFLDLDMYFEWNFVPASSLHFLIVFLLYLHKHLLQTAFQLEKLMMFASNNRKN